MAFRLTPKSKRNISRIIPFGIIWLFIALLFMITDLTATGFQGAQPSVIVLTPRIITFALVSLMCIGLVVGTIEILFMERRFRHRSLTRKIIYKFLIYGGFLFSTIAITYPIALVMEPASTLEYSSIWNEMVTFFLSATFVSTAVQLGFSLLVSLFYTTISENIGYNALINLFTGRYHKPKVEQRIFMFLDMKNSTTIAEKLGHLQYFELLQQYYEAMSDPIINHFGEVYQYIGDEVVVSWTLDRGLNEGHCLHAFFDIGKSIESRRDRFMDQFGVVPGFKAGMHYGEVTTGEIGALKKEIVFTGDVLNTTARLQSLCSENGVDLIISEELLNALSFWRDSFVIEDLGTVQLKGKSEVTHIHAVSEKPAF